MPGLTLSQIPCFWKGKKIWSKSEISFLKKNRQKLPQFAYDVEGYLSFFEFHICNIAKFG
jgi:hypothetical protein